MGWNIPQEIPHLNATDKTSQFRPEILKKIAAQNWADIELYEYASALYDTQKNRTVSLSGKLSKNPINTVSNCQYSFDQRIEGYGWGNRERVDGTGTIYRWATEKNEAAIDFYLQKDKDYRFQCSILIQPVFCDQLTLLVNNVHIPLKKINSAYKSRLDYNWLEYQAIIPRDVIAIEEKTRIIFKMVTPKGDSLCQFYKEDNRNQSILANYIRGKFACKEIKIIDETL